MLPLHTPSHVLGEVAEDGLTVAVVQGLVEAADDLDPSGDPSPLIGVP